MKRLGNFVAVLAIVLVLSGVCPGEGGESADGPCATYFFVPGQQGDLEKLPLKSTSAAVNISGVIADVQVTQVYENQGKTAIEAVYLFPASTRAAVYGMKMTIGERTIIATMKKKEDASRQYEEAVKQGKTASLLEQHRPNVFQMSVGNIIPGDSIKVELKYTEVLVPTDKIYEFIYPTVAGPRYARNDVPPADRWVGNPYLKQGQAPTYSFDIRVNLLTGVPVGEISSPSHKIEGRYNGPSSANVVLASGQANGGNKDFLLRYTLADRQIDAGLLLYQAERENFFLLMVQPPKRVSEKEIPGREYIFIVDVSGSMHGFPLEISKKLLRDIIGNLRVSDTFNVLLFSGGSTVMSERSLPATKDNIAKATTIIGRQAGGGGTELLPALTRALALPRTEGFSRTVVIVTDGYVAVEEEAFDLIRATLGDANTFAFGIGSSVNRHLIEGMARVGAGEPFVVTKTEEAPQKAESFRKLIQTPVLTHITVHYEGFKVYDVKPLSVPDLFADRPVLVYGKWRGSPRGTIRIEGTTGGGSYSEIIDVGAVKPDEKNAALRFLWARNRISFLSDYNILRSDQQRIEEVTGLGLHYNLLTAYTSFVAVDALARNTTGTTTTVTQPLPLPEGVSNYAVAAPAPNLQGITEPKSARKAPPRDLAPKEEEALPGNDKTSSPSKIAKVEADHRQHETGIAVVLRSKLAEIDKCLVQAGFRDRLFLSLVIRQGRVRAVSSPASKAINQCLEQTMKDWHFGSHLSARATVTIVW